MQTSQTISDLRRGLTEVTLESLWRQWTQLGVSGATEGSDTWAIDLERLLLFSLPTARRDPRLFDEILDWMTANGALLSGQRIKNLLGRLESEDKNGVADSRVIRAALAWAADRGVTTLRWWAQDTDGDAEPHHLFPELSPARSPDPVFRRFGLLRGPVDARGMSQPPNPLVPSNLVIRLRHLFGVTARAEVLQILLTTDETVNTQRVTDIAGFARRNVTEVLKDLEEAGVIASAKRGRTRAWRANRERWAHLFGWYDVDLPDLVDWDAKFRSLRKLDSWLDEDAAADQTDYLRASSARRLLESIRDDLFAVDISIPGRIDASVSLDVLAETGRSLIRSLEPA